MWDVPDGILVWADVLHPGRNVAAVTLAGLVDDGGLRCGTVESERPSDLDGADLSWRRWELTADRSLDDLAEREATGCRPEITSRRCAPPG